MSYVIFTLLAGWCNLFLIEAMQAIPGNKYFQGDVEFSTLINFFFGPRLHLAGQFLLYCALQSNSIQCLVLTAQATDQFITHIFGKTCGLSMSFRWICVPPSETLSPSPFANTMMIFTLGLLVAMLFSIPLFFYDLDRSVSLTVGASCLSLCVALAWVGMSIDAGLEASRMPTSTRFGIDYGQTMGTVMLNLGCATVVPSWINIKSNIVHTQSVMWTTLTASSLFYLIIGIFFSLGFDSNESKNSLQALIQTGNPTLLAQITVALYAYLMLLPSVPVNCIVSSQNLIQNQIVGPRTGIFLAFVLPLFACIPLQTNNYLFLFLTWTSLIFTASVNFVIPLGLYLQCVHFRQKFKDRVLTLHQLKLLAAIHSKSIEIETFIQEQQDQPPILVERFEGSSSSKKITPRIVLTAPTAKHIARPSPSQSPLTPEEVLHPEVMDYFSTKDRATPPKRQYTLDLEYQPISIKVIPPSPYPRLSDKQFLDPESESDDGSGSLEPNSLSSERKNSDANQPSEKNSASIKLKYRNNSTLGRPTDINQVTFRTFSGASRDTHRLTIKVDKRSRGEYPSVDLETFLDPEVIGIPAEWQEDLPDPDAQVQLPPEEIPLQNTDITHSDTSIPEFLSLPPGVALRRGSSFSSGSISGSSGVESLPREREFRCPPFRAIPKWFPMAPYTFCLCLLVVTITLSLGNIVVNAVFQ
ncbi:hypothetical protein HDV03_000191 [Kappamyces sp. JEL0829]|nr:hypothetical protein HDV03_000191 [Kappamyces sp. JEL0829]